MFNVVQGVYSVRVKKKEREYIFPCFNVITNEARELIALSMFDGATTPTEWQIGLIGREHVAFGAPTTNITDPLGPPYLTSNPIYNDIFAVSGLQINATAEVGDLNGPLLPTLDTIFARKDWVKGAPQLIDDKFAVPASDFISYTIPSDTAVYGFYIVDKDGTILLSVAPFSWVRTAPRQPFGTRPNGGGGFGDVQWNTGNGPLVEGDVLEVAYTLGSQI